MANPAHTVNASAGTLQRAAGSGLGQRHYDLCRRRQAGAEAVEDLFEGRHHPYQQCGSDDECQQQDCDGIRERRLDLGALRGAALAVVGDASQHHGERASCFTDRDQLAIERIELRRMPRQRRRETQAARDVARQCTDDA